ncbi:membrane protein [Levilactobacillus spicheri]|uniref:Membrane protein n=1 Tax=Levilactobacillus spicheri TaxID=216463 RepID=A0A0F3RS65_9LACO|nr:membrane protein [Levilactobacillus spicheri]
MAAILSALTVALSLLVVIPIPATHGMVTLCEVGIYTSAILFGNPVGFLVGGASGFLIDLISGFPEWCLFSLVIHGVQGAIVAYLTSNQTVKGMILPLVLGGIVMVTGYYLATWLLFGWAAGLASVPGNLVQVGFGMVVTIPLVLSLIKFNPKLIKGS